MTDNNRNGFHMKLNTVILVFTNLFLLLTVIALRKNLGFIGQALPTNARLYLQSSTSQFSLGQQYSIGLVLDTDGASISGTDVILNFIPADMALVSIDPVLPTSSNLQLYLPKNTSGGFDKESIKSQANASGTIKFSVLTANNTTALPPFAGTKILATITIRPLRVGSSRIWFSHTLSNTRDSNITSVGNIPSDILQNVGDLNLQMVVPTLTPTPSTPPPTVRPTAIPTQKATPTPTLKPTVIPTVKVQGVSPGVINNNISVQVNATYNDLNQEGNALDSAYHPAHKRLWLGTGSSVSSSYTGLRFTNISIPRGTIIDSAYIEVYADTTQWISAPLLLTGDNVGNSLIYSNTNLPSQRAQTNAKVQFDASGNWNSGYWYKLGEIKSIISEITNRTDWQSGNALSIVIKGTSTSSFARKFVSSFDGDPSHAPKLVITTQ